MSNHNTTVRWIYLILVALLELLILPGCRTVPEQTPEVTPLVGLSTPPSSPAPEPKREAEAAQAPVFVQPPTKVWVRLVDLVSSNGIAAQLARLPKTIHGYQFQTAEARLDLAACNRLARWNGVNCWLGYAPPLIGSQVHIHALDVQKTLLPLLTPLAPASHSRRIVVIDPGHGGRSPGTQNIITGRYEKEYTLDWALRIANLLKTNGWQTVLTRTNDVDVPIPDRIALADAVQADLFISLHFNSSFPNHEPGGLETYCLTPAGMPSSLVRDFADDSRQVFVNNGFDHENLQYAVRLHRALLQATGFPDQSVRRARFMGVLRGQKRPSVLIEGGYLSNPEEARLIASPWFRQKMAAAIAGVIGQVRPSQ